MCLLTKILIENNLNKDVINIICKFIGHVNFNYKYTGWSDGNNVLILEAGHTLDDCLYIPYYRDQASCDSIRQGLKCIAKEVKYLKLDDCTTKDVYTCQVMSYFTHVVELEAGRCSSMGRDAVQMLTGFTQLETLSLYGHYWDSETIELLGKILARMPHLKNFKHQIKGDHQSGRDFLKLYFGCRSLEVINLNLTFDAGLSLYYLITSSSTWGNTLTLTLTSAEPVTQTQTQEITPVISTAQDYSTFPRHLLTEGKSLSQYRDYLLQLPPPINIGRQLKELRGIRLDPLLPFYIACNCPNLERIDGSAEITFNNVDHDSVLEIFKWCSKLKSIEFCCLKIGNANQWIKVLESSLPRLQEINFSKLDLTSLEDTLKFYDFAFRNRENFETDFLFVYVRKDLVNKLKVQNPKFLEEYSTV